ncbi:hypothetical protein B7463_g10593, partial [Scytalidium lignicola]
MYISHAAVAIAALSMGISSVLATTLTNEYPSPSETMYYNKVWDSATYSIPNGGSAEVPGGWALIWSDSCPGSVFKWDDTLDGVTWLGGMLVDSTIEGTGEFSARFEHLLF